MNTRRDGSREQSTPRRWLWDLGTIAVLCLLGMLALAPAEGRSEARPAAQPGRLAPQGAPAPKQPPPDAKQPAAGITITTSGPVGTPGQIHLPADVAAALQGSAGNAPQDWEVDFTQDFEGEFPGGLWSVEDFGDDGYDRTWGVDTSRAASGTASVWVAAGGDDGIDPSPAGTGNYPDNLDSWMIVGPLDLTDAQMADVDFEMWYDTEVDFDSIFVGASTDGENFDGQYWDGDSGGWDHFVLDLGSYVGLDDVWVAWVFTSDESNPEDYAGVWIDEATLWVYTEGAPPQRTNLLENPGFETGDTTGWNTEGTTDVFEDNPHSGSYSAWLGGVHDTHDRLWQVFPQAPADTNEARVSFWLALESEETATDVDTFCAGIHDADTDDLLVDLGCLDGTEPTYGWSQVEYTLTGAELLDVLGRTAYIDFTLDTDGSLLTSAWIDDVAFAVRTGGTGGDAYEDNDAPSTATPLAFGTPLADLTIDPAGDADFFRFDGTNGQEITLDIDAEVNGSGLDSYLWLLDTDGATVLAENDDDGSTFDSHLTYTLPADGTYYAIVRSYSGDGDRSFFYTLSLTSGGGPTPTPTPTTPTPTPTPPPDQKAWTAILYLAGDTNLWREYQPYIDQLEALVGAKSDFLDIVVLLDLAPEADNPGSVRLHIQPDGNYTDGVNRWNMGELNMGDPRTLVNFTQWAIRNYPAEHYYLAIDDHGNSVGGIAWDDTSDGDNLRPRELYEILKEVTDNGAFKLDVIDWEACLMLTYEGAYDVRNFADYLFGFESVSYGGDTYPSYFESLTATTTPRQFVDDAVDAYFENRSGAVVGAAVDLSQMDAVASTVNDLADGLLAQLGASKDAMTAARSAAQKFEVDGDIRITDADYYADLWHLADRLADQVPAVSSAANAVKTAVESAVIDFQVQSSPGEDHRNAHGLAVFWPEWVSGAYSDYVNGDLFRVAQDGTWDDFLNSYFGRRPSDRKGMPVNPDPVEKRSGGNPVYLPLVLTSGQ